MSLFFFYYYFSFLFPTSLEKKFLLCRTGKSSGSALSISIDFSRSPCFSKSSHGIACHLSWNNFSEIIWCKYLFRCIKLFAILKVPVKSENIELNITVSDSLLFSQSSNYNSFSKHSLELALKQRGYHESPSHVFCKDFAVVLNYIFLFY